MCQRGIYQPMSIAIFFVAMLICMSSCKHNNRKKLYINASREDIPAMQAQDIQTLISDSGVIRYRIESPLWQIYDRQDSVLWEFPKGVYLEQFDEDLSVRASLKADYAFYNNPLQLWILRGNVESMNLDGERFYTPELYWSQTDDRVYSDSSITIYQQSSVITGVGFESDSKLTRYTILNPKGSFPIEDE